MAFTSRRDRTAGAALWEGVVALVVVAALVGIGVYLTLHRPAPTTNSSVSTTTTNASDVTTSDIDKQAQSDAASEQSVDQNADAQAQQDALSANGAASNVGGAYNESTL